MRDLPLAGYRVLDFCWLAAGPVMTRLLADLGADVVKVESIARLDRIREVGPQPTGKFSINTNGLFHTANANKKSVTINLGTQEGLDIIRGLVRESDIVSSNFTPNRMDRWGLGYDDLKVIKDDIIVVSLPVMGKEGRRSDWGSYGNGIVAMCGLGYLTGSPKREPVGLGTLHSDFSIPYLGALQVIGALYQRERQGGGQFIEVAQYEAATHLLDTELYEYLLNGEEPARIGNRSREFVPHGVFPAAGEDRWLAITARNAFEWQRLCLVIGRGDLAARDDLQRVEGRRAAEGELEQAISAWTSLQNADEAAELLAGAGVAASPVRDIGDIVEKTPAAGEHYPRLPHPEGVDIAIENEPVLWDGERLGVSRAPSMGEHNEWLLHEVLRLKDERVTELLVNEVIQ